MDKFLTVIVLLSDFGLTTLDFCATEGTIVFAQMTRDD